jgi:hypothetical protein
MQAIFSVRISKVTGACCTVAVEFHIHPNYKGSVTMVQNLINYSLISYNNAQYTVYYLRILNKMYSILIIYINYYGL